MPGDTMTDAEQRQMRRDRRRAEIEAMPAVTLADPPHGFAADAHYGIATTGDWVLIEPNTAYQFGREHSEGRLRIILTPIERPAIPEWLRFYYPGRYLIVQRHCKGVLIYLVAATAHDSPERNWANFDIPTVEGLRMIHPDVGPQNWKDFPDLPDGEHVASYHIDPLPATND